MDIPKSIQDLVLAHANLTEDGIAAFRDKDFSRTIGLLTQAIDQDKNNWKARLYLAMAHYNLAQVYTATIHFRYLSDHCPNQTVRSRAQTALAAMASDLKRGKQE